jgi:hypothetical protein
MIEDLEINRCNQKHFFNTSSNIKNGCKPLTKILTNKIGNLITKEKKIINKFKDFFEKLLNRPFHNNAAEEIDYHIVEPEIETRSILQLTVSKIIKYLVMIVW